MPHEEKCVSERLNIALVSPSYRGWQSISVNYIKFEVPMYNL